MFLVFTAPRDEARTVTQTNLGKKRGLEINESLPPN